MNQTATEPQESAAPPWHGWKAFFLEPLARANAEARAYLATEASRRADRKVILVLVTAALCLTAQRYLALEDVFARLASLLRRLGGDDLADRLLTVMWIDADAQLYRLTWWVAVSLVAYVAVPALVIRLLLGERVRDYGVKLSGAFADCWVYGAMFAVAGPLVFLASAAQGFQDTYPFYRLAPGELLSSNFWRWEMLYFLQFFGVEFFFRGFLVHGLRQRFGAYAIFIMMVPYCMLHFLKPLPETLASIVGAIALGFMSLRTRSIWMGTAIHVTVAASMDFASLWRQGLLR